MTWGWPPVSGTDGWWCLRPALIVIPSLGHKKRPPHTSHATEGKKMGGQEKKRGWRKCTCWRDPPGNRWLFRRSLFTYKNCNSQSWRQEAVLTTASSARRRKSMDLVARKERREENAKLLNVNSPNHILLSCKNFPGQKKKRMISEKRYFTFDQCRAYLPSCIFKASFVLVYVQG